MARKVIKSARKPAKTIRIAEDISINEKQHEKLVKHVTDRLDYGKELRDITADKFEEVDREIAGYIKHTPEDKKREQDNRLGKGPKVTDQNLPLVLAQLDEAVTYILSLLAPDDGIYQAISSKEKQKIAKGFAALMNKNAKDFSHYRNMARAVFEMLKYNFGGNIVEWREIRGNKIKNSSGGSGQLEIVNEVVVAGNAIDAIDPYNFIYDISVPAVDLSKNGEFFATVELRNKFRVKKMKQNGELFGVERFIDSTETGMTYYFPRPIIHADDSRSSGGTDWIRVLSANSAQDVVAGFELVNFYAWLIPNEFGLSPSKEFEIWRLVLINGKYIADAEQLTNAHGMLPVAIGRPWDDGFEDQTKSFGELLIPFQRFASFQMNIHQRAARKAVYGVTIYNARMLPNLAEADMEAAKIPANPAAQGGDFDIRKHVLQFTDTPNTQNTLRDIEATDSLMQKVLPTDMLRQVTDLERATKYQAASVVQASNRRNHKITKIINDQCFDPLRRMQMFNIFQFQESITIIDQEGTEIQVNPSDFREANLESDISDGLKGVDKLGIVEGMKEIANMILQSQVASQQTDIMAFIDYLSTLMGDKTDFNQFKIKSQIDLLPPDQKDIAFQLYQQFIQQQQGGQQPGVAQ